jgi:hypothetical protein
VVRVTGGIILLDVRWLGLCGRILGIALVGVILAGLGFGLTRSSGGHALPPCLSYVHTTECVQPGANISNISLPPLAVGAVLVTVWLTLAILLVRNWLRPEPDWI